MISSGADSRGGLHKNREKTSLRVRTLLFQESRVADSLKVGTIYSILKNINVVEYKRTNDQHTYRYLHYQCCVSGPFLTSSRPEFLNFWDPGPTFGTFLA